MRRSRPRTSACRATLRRPSRGRLGILERSVLPALPWSLLLSRSVRRTPIAVLSLQVAGHAGDQGENALRGSRIRNFLPSCLHRPAPGRDANCRPHRHHIPRIRSLARLPGGVRGPRPGGIVRALSARERGAHAAQPLLAVRKIAHRRDLRALSAPADARVPRVRAGGGPGRYAVRIRSATASEEVTGCFTGARPRARRA